MEKSIAQYQKSFHNIMNILKANSKVLAMLVSGSIVNGDLWDESDIDIMIICDNDESEISNLYTEEEDISIHIKVLKKEEFIEKWRRSIGGSSFQRNLSSSRLMFSKDMDITNIYNGGRYYADADRGRWSLCYLSSLLKTLKVARKYTYNNSFYTAYSVLIRALEEFSRLYVNISGYTISHDALIMACSIDDDFKEHAERILRSSYDDIDMINDALSYFDLRIRDTIKTSTAVLLNFLKQKDKQMSAEEIKNDEMFRDFDIDIEELLKTLWKNGLINKKKRAFNTDDGNLLAMENIYYI